jgi:hypothetical protein
VARLVVEAGAREVLGDRASEWMVKPTKLLDGMVPAELASSQEVHVSFSSS